MCSRSSLSRGRSAIGAAFHMGHDAPCAVSYRHRRPREAALPRPICDCLLDCRQGTKGSHRCWRLPVAQSAVKSTQPTSGPLTSVFPRVTRSPQGVDRKGDWLERHSATRPCPHPSSPLSWIQGEDAVARRASRLGIARTSSSNNSPACMHTMDPAGEASR